MLKQDPSDPIVRAETARRRTFAIISHPDAGKTTLTEKLLLYAGCFDVAGAVRGRKTQRSATSDWMELERQRGISISSTALSFEYAGASDQPARYARPPGLQRRHLPHVDRGRLRGDGHRPGQGNRGSDGEALSRVHDAKDSDHHVREQGGPARTRPLSTCLPRWRSCWASRRFRSTGRSGRDLVSAAFSTEGRNGEKLFQHQSVGDRVVRGQPFDLETVDEVFSTAPPRASLKKTWSFWKAPAHPFEQGRISAWGNDAGFLRQRH